jgi:hypothetical protein
MNKSQALLRSMNNAESIIWQADWRRRLSAANWKLFRIWRTGTERQYDAGELDSVRKNKSPKAVHRTPPGL